MSRHKIVIEPAFQLGQQIWHALGGEDSRGIVTGFVVRPDGVLYRVVWADRQEETHYEAELSAEETTDF